MYESRLEVLRVSDLDHVPEDVVAMYDDDSANRGILVFPGGQQS
jgi:hypothetical protein